jgi:hypothetical protein
MPYFDLHKVPLSEGINIIGIICFLLLPPFWYLFQFEPAIFKQFNILTLLLLSISISIPLLVINGITVHKALDIGIENDREDELAELFFASIINLPVFYLPCLLSYFTHVSSRNALWISTLVELVILLSITYTILEENWKNRRSKRLKGTRSHPESTPPAASQLPTFPGSSVE